MWIVLAHGFDESALWAFRRLRARSRRRIELVLVEALDTPLTTWVHEVGRRGARIEVRLGDGRRLGTPGVRAVLNRLAWPPVGLLGCAAPADAVYAQSELTAFAVSWARALAPVVVNPPTPQGLSGRWRPSLHWRVMGVRAGLPVAPMRVASTAHDHAADNAPPSTMILTVGGVLLFDAAPGAIRQGVRRLAASSGTPILGLQFAGADPAGRLAAAGRHTPAGPEPGRRGGDRRTGGGPRVVILFCGIPSEASPAMVVDALNRHSVGHVVVNQRQVREMAVELQVDDAALHGQLSGPGYQVDLARVTAVYLRLMDDRWLPELEGERPESPVRAAGRALHEILGQWADVTPARVVNRYFAMGSNFSKPYQLQLIREHGFSIPETLVTNDPERVVAFRDACGPLIYKSISTERSIVRRLDEHDVARLDRIRWCPVQFQAFVPGPNLRIHVVGEEVFATLIDTEAVDYRYATQQTGRAAVFMPYHPDDDLAERCVALTRALGLEVAGLDLKLVPNGRVTCLEVNPSPVFSYYQLQTRQPIADAIARLLNKDVHY